MSEQDVDGGRVVDEDVEGDYRYTIRKYADMSVRLFRTLLNSSSEEEVLPFLAPTRVRRKVTEARNLVST